MGSNGATLKFHKNISVTCASNKPANCYCTSGRGKNHGTAYSAVCCSTNVSVSAGKKGPRGRSQTLQSLPPFDWRPAV